MKKLINSMLIFSIMNLAGCYYQEQMNPSDYNFEDHYDIQITTKDTTYDFDGSNYYFDNDTLIATVSKSLDERSKLKYNINIPIETIEKIEVKKLDTMETAITIGIIVLIVVGLITLSSLGDNYSSSGLLGTSK